MLTLLDVLHTHDKERHKLISMRVYCTNLIVHLHLLYSKTWKDLLIKHSFPEIAVILFPTAQLPVWLSPQAAPSLQLLHQTGGAVQQVTPASSRATPSAEKRDWKPLPGTCTYIIHVYIEYQAFPRLFRAMLHHSMLACLLACFFLFSFDVAKIIATKPQSFWRVSFYFASLRRT